jgi:hypothetical protein
MYILNKIETYLNISAQFILTFNRNNEFKQ